MNAPQRHLTELIGSRICHDLISPLGAISNGVELMNMNGDVSGPEMSLISQSVENANARIRFFRIAFGAARQDQQIGKGEISGILEDLHRGGRVTFDWQPQGDLSRQHVKLVFLLLQCFETAMPWGGRITVTSVGNDWAVYGEADQMKLDKPLWQSLAHVENAIALEPSLVHFALAPLSAQAMAVNLTVELSETSARVRF